MEEKRIVEDMVKNAQPVYSEIKDGVLVKFDERDLGNECIYETPKGVKEIAGGAFKNCAWLRTLIIGEDVEKIGACAFMGCENLESVDMKENVKKMGGAAFYNCYSLWEIKLSDGLTEVPEQTFYNCGNLYRVFLPKNLEKIGKYAFCDCSEFRCITPPPATLTEVGYMAFSGAPIGNKFMSAFKANKAITKQNAKLK